jgi:hypothetical protein
MSNRLGGKQGTAYLGTNAQQPPNWNFYPHDPTIYTYQNFSLGDLWLNTVTQQAFVLVSLERNTVTNEFNAIWTDFTGTPAGVVESLQAADGTVAFPVNGQIDFPNTVITGNTNSVTNILTSAQPNNGGNFLINLTPQISLRNDTNGVDSITLEQISVSGGAWNSTLKFLRANGTIAAPTAVSNNFGLGSLRFFGYTGSGYTAAPSAGIKSLVKGVVVDNPNPALSAVPACLAFAVSETQLTAPFDLNSLDIKLQVDPDGQVYVKNGNLVVNTPPVAVSALTVYGFNTAGTYGQQNIAVTPGAKFDAFRAINNTTTAGSGCQIEVAVDSQAAATGGDPILTFANYGGTTPNYSIGQDTSAQQFVLSKSPTLGTTNIMTVTNSNNQINYPEQCSFYALVGTNLVNVTGNATGVTPLYHPPFTNVIRNVSNSFTGATGRFVAPIGGMYSFSTELYITGVNNINYSLCQIGFAVNGNGFIQGLVNPWYRTDGTFGYCSVNNSAMFQLNQNDYVEVAFLVYNGALTVGVTAGPGSYFSGQLLS